MRRIVALLLCVGMLAGCALFKKKPAPPPPQSAKKEPAKVILTPQTGATGKVVRVNDTARFAVLNYPVGGLPAIGTHLNVYRQGLKVGEIRVSGPQQEDSTVGDILSGDVQVGDQLRGD